MDSEESLYSGRIDFSKDIPEFIDRMEFKQAVGIASRENPYSPILIVDVYGIRKKTINAILLKNLKNRRNKTWFLTNVENAGDVFDAFNTDAHMVLFPYKSVKSNYDLLDIVSVSNSVIPSLFVRKGKLFGVDGNIFDVTSRIFEAGFQTVSIFDTDGSLTIDDWKKIFSMGNIIPFSINLHESVFEYLGARDIFSIDLS